MKTETWLDHEIRFIEKNGEWWAVASDVAKALGFLNAHNATHKMADKYKGSAKVITPSGEQTMITLSEKGLYRLIMRSNKPEAEEFQDWVFETIKQLRKSAGLEGFQVFRMMDKEHQKEAMEKLKSSLTKPTKVDFIKANTITNKAVSNMYGYPKMVKKGDMSPDMLLQRQQVLEDTVSLMGAVERFNLDIPVAKTVYQKYS